MYSIFHNITAEQSYHLQRFANHFDISSQNRNISCEHRHSFCGLSRAQSAHIYFKHLVITSDYLTYYDSIHQFA